MWKRLLLRLRCQHDWREYARTWTGAYTHFLFRCTRCPAMKRKQLPGRVLKPRDELEAMIK